MVTAASGARLPYDLLAEGTRGDSFARGASLQKSVEEKSDCNWAATWSVDPFASGDEEDSSFGRQSLEQVDEYCSEKPCLMKTFFLSRSLISEMVS